MPISCSDGLLKKFVDYVRTQILPSLSLPSVLFIFLGFSEN